MYRREKFNTNLIIADWIRSYEARIKQRGTTLKSCAICNTLVRFWDTHWPSCEAEARTRDKTFLKAYYPEVNWSEYIINANLRDTVRTLRLQFEQKNQPNLSIHQHRSLSGDVVEAKEQRIENLKIRQTYRSIIYLRTLQKSLPKYIGHAHIKNIHQDLLEGKIDEHLSTVQALGILHIGE